MPQLVKGGKYIFGWTTINSDLRIRIPDETYGEYQLMKADKVIILSGSKSSGGFSIITPKSVIISKLGNNIVRLIGYKKKTKSFTSELLKIIRSGDRLISWTFIDKDKYFRLSDGLMDSLNLKTGDKLLVGRGSGLGPAFIRKGTIYNEAIKHKDILEFN
ncbi:MAG: hypothetical protein JXB49_02265 [Bacteroidales bacterium]|nr:hypothetical protein [Bacteroidales bacterium]